MNTAGNAIVQKSFIVGRPIVATVQRYDIVTFDITLTDDRGRVVDLTGCQLRAITEDKEIHLWNAEIVNPLNGQFKFTFQPEIIGRLIVKAEVIKSSGTETVKNTFFLGTVVVALENNSPAEHIKDYLEYVKQKLDEGGTVDISMGYVSQEEPSVVKTGSGLNCQFALGLPNIIDGGSIE